MAAAAGDMGQQASPVDRGGVVGRPRRRPRSRPGSAADRWSRRSAPHAAAGLAGEGDDQRHAGRILMPVHLVPEAALAQHVAMVGGEEGDGLAFEPAIAQGLHQAAQLIVDIGDGAVIGAARGADMGLGDLVAVHVRDMAQAPPMGVVSDPAMSRASANRSRPRGSGSNIPAGSHRDHGDGSWRRRGRRAGRRCRGPGRRASAARHRPPPRRNRAGWSAGRARLASPRACCGTSSAGSPAVPNPASSRNPRDRYPSSAAPRSHGAGRGRRNASCRRGRCDSRPGGGNGRRSECRQRNRRHCRRPRCRRGDGRPSWRNARGRRAGWRNRLTRRPCRDRPALRCCGALTSLWPWIGRKPGAIWSAMTKRMLGRLVIVGFSQTLFAVIPAKAGIQGE